MTNVLLLKERMRNFYGRNEIFITPIIKFLLALCSLVMINGNLGYMNKIDNAILVLLIALMCSFLPINFIIMISAAFVLLHFYALAIECALVGLAIFILLFTLYFRFTPKDTLTVLLLPLCFILKIPYIFPLALGLLSTPISIISLCSGIIVNFMILLVKENATVFNTMDAESAMQKFRFMIDGMLANKEMIVTMVAFSATIIVVYIIRRMRIDYAWTIAIVAGALCNGVILFVGDLLFDTNISIVWTITGSIISILMAKVLQFFAFNVDYSRTEFVQFEDDEYYYYVKAVPKIALSTPEKKVKKINAQKRIQESELRR